MSEVIYSDIDLLIDEKYKEIVINPKGERFYFVECEQQSGIFYDASVRFNEEQGYYEIQGWQSLYSEHNAMGFSYEKLLCLHPSELIKIHSFLGLKWYSVSGVMKRKIQSVYKSRHKEYRIYLRTQILSRTIEEK